MINLIDIQFVEITAQYSNAVLLAILPYVSEFAKTMDLPISLPVTLDQVQAFGCDHRLGDPGGVLRLTNGCVFEFWHGHVNEFKTRDRYFDLQNPRLVPKFYGELRMTDSEAVKLCRTTISKLGYTEEMLYADLPPRIEYPAKVGTNVVPRYIIGWVDPRDGRPSCEFEINGQERRIDKVYLMSRNLWREPPKLDVPAQPRIGGRLKSRFQAVNREYARRLLPVVLLEFTDYARKLELPVTLPITTNQAATYICRKFDGSVYADITLTSGHHFFYRYGMVQCYDAPDSFFDFAKPGVLVKDFIGSWRIDDSQALALARATLKRLGYGLETLYADQVPEITKPRNVSSVPRIQLEWLKVQNGMQLSRTIVEIDAEHGALKSLYLSNYQLRRPMPDVGVPPNIE